MDNVVYHPNHGTYQQQLRGKDLTDQYIVVDQNRNGFHVKFPNIFTDYVILTAPKQRVDVWQRHPFEFWQTQLDFAVWCATSGCGISIEHLKSSIPMVQSVYRFHVYFQIRRILYDLEVYLPFKVGFKKYSNRYNHDTYVRLLREFGIDSDDESNWRNQKFFSSYQARRAEFRDTPGLSYLDENSWSR